VLATGSEATRPQALHDALGDKLITTDELFYLDALPRSLAVVGWAPSAWRWAWRCRAWAVRWWAATGRAVSG
jgi:pyruvate/2-oxoglutarate dehydrogenase complex dihydrolipoamide dehydrogenase (E3) component